MDAYEATRIVFSRIQTLDPENAAKIMGLLLIQDHGEKEMIRLAFGPETLLHSVILKARKELGLLLPPPSPPSPSLSSSPFANHHHHLSRQNSSTSSRFGFAHHPPPPLNITSPSWAPPDHLQTPTSEDLLNNSSPYYNNGGGGGGGDLVDEISIQDQLSFLNDPLYQEMGGGGWPHSHRRSSSVADLCLGSEAAGASGFGWKPCLYFARGYCKNGTSCRFLHGLPNDELGSPMAKSDIGIGMEQHCQEQLQLLRSKSQRLSAAAAGAFPYSPTGSMTMPLSPSSSKCMSFLLQQQNDNQRVAAAAAAAAALMLGDEGHKFMGGRSRLDRADFAGMVNPGSRQIYLTFPADSTFREEDVSNYFSIYGPVQDVRIPYQQKRMFGFVTFVYPETVKLILAKGNPHFVCDARVLVKPYKEKGKVPDKYRKQQGERGDFSGCTTPTGLDSRDQYDLQQLGARMLYNSNNNSTSQEMLLRRKLEEQQQAAELQQAIELQGRRFMGLQLLDFKARSLSSPSPPITINPSNEYNREESSPEDKSPSPASSGGEQQINSVNVSAATDKEESARETSPNEDSDFQESVEHNLPDSPFASPTKATAFGGDLFAVSAQADAEPLGNGNHLITSTLLPPTSSLDMASFKSCLFQMPRFSSGHGAVGL